MWSYITLVGTAKNDSVHLVPAVRSCSDIFENKEALSVEDELWENSWRSLHIHHYCCPQSITTEWYRLHDSTIVWCVISKQTKCKPTTPKTAVLGWIWTHNTCSLCREPCTQIVSYGYIGLQVEANHKLLSVEGRNSIAPTFPSFRWTLCESHGRVWPDQRQRGRELLLHGSPHCFQRRKYFRVQLSVLPHSVHEKTLIMVWGVVKSLPLDLRLCCWGTGCGQRSSEEWNQQQMFHQVMNCWKRHWNKKKHANYL